MLKVTEADRRSAARTWLRVRAQLHLKEGLSFLSEEEKNLVGDVKIEWKASDRAAGVASRSIGGIAIIKLSSTLHSKPEDDAELRDTVLHELAHFIAPQDAHGPAWQAAAQRLGAKPEACHTMPTKRRGKVVLKCEGCGYRALAHEEDSIDFVHDAAHRHTCPDGTRSRWAIDSNQRI